MKPANALGGCVAFLLIGTFLFCGGLLGLAFITGKPTQNQTATQSKPDPFAAFKFIASKRDGVASFMELYEYTGPLDQKTLIDFVQSRKGKTLERFHYIYLFDNASNALFPTNPFTAGYGLDQIEVLKHVRANWGFNNLNDWQELQMFDKNAAESRPITISLP